LIDVSPFENGYECFNSESLTIENGTEAVFVELIGNFGRNARDLETLRNVHEFLGRVIAAIEAMPDLPADPEAPGTDTVVIKSNPLLD